jgi:hypothetical protein
MATMARQQGPFDWQGRLESEGSVTFGPSRWFSWLLLVVAIVALLGFGYAVVTDGPTVWAVIGAVLLAACVVYTGRTTLMGTGDLTVTRDGFRTGRGPVIAFDRLAAVATVRTNLTIHYAPLPGQRLTGRQRTTGQKAWYLSLPRWSSMNPDDLAVWLLKLKGGPTAEVDAQVRAGISRVFRLRD